jgi:hypothetical protein
MRSGKELQFSHSQTSAGPFSFYHLSPLDTRGGVSDASPEKFHEGGQEPYHHGRREVGTSIGASGAVG